MAKIVVRSGNKVYSIIRETREERCDRIWNEKYLLFLEVIKKVGHQSFHKLKTSPNYLPEFSILKPWVNKQRELYKKSNLIDWRYKLLEKAGFIWDPMELLWNKNYKKLAIYQKNHGHCNVMYSDEEYSEIAQWSSNQRRNKNKLSSERIKKLNEIGFDWITQSEKWMKMYENFIKFYQDKGHQRVPKKTSSPDYSPENELISNWVVVQRMAYKGNYLPEWKYILLEKIGFIFEPFETSWNNFYQSLIDFRNINGHLHISRFDKNFNGLSAWCTSQRMDKEKLSPEKIKKLNDIGFDWGKKVDPWDKMYEIIKKYYEENGTAYVPSDASKNNSEKLTNWCRKQIMFYNQKTLSKDRIKLLQEINFDFNHYANKLDKIWNEKYQRLIEYKNKFGNCNVPNHWKEDNSLSRWVELNRKNRNKLLPEKYKKLDDLGFTWQFAVESWEKNILNLKQYKEANGHCNVKYSEDKNLNGWVSRIRDFKKKKLMKNFTEDNIKELTDLGFDWSPLITHWEQCFQEMDEFINKNGHSNVNTRKNPVLYTWIRSNRKNRSKLSEEQISRLNEIGFIW